MRKQKYGLKIKRRSFLWVRYAIVALILGSIFMMVLYFVDPLNGFVDRSQERETEAMTKMIDRALVQCYALEGAYPSTLEYLTRYGISLDVARYDFEYDFMFPNIRPYVSITPK